jgi:hypothetical protein
LNNRKRGGTKYKKERGCGKMSLDKARKQIDGLIEKVYIDPSIDKPKDKDEIKKAKVKISVDTSDEASTQFSPRSESGDIEESSDTVYGQGTNPKPEDETYLSLLKGTTKSKVKVTINKDEKRPDPAL